MGLSPSKEELLYHQVSYGNVQGIRALHRDGAGLEWVDKEGKTPLMVACMMPNGLPVVETLVELGANVNAFRPGSHNGTPLHHAAKKGLSHIVDFLLLHGANPCIINDTCQTPLDIARAKGFPTVVRTIESRISLFSGWLRLRSSVPNLLESFMSTLLTKKIWAVVLPCDHRNYASPQKFELAMYSDLQTSQPYATVPLWKSSIEEPNFNDLDPAMVICDKKTRYKLSSANEGDKQQLIYLHNACKGYSQQIASVPLVPCRPPFAVPTAPAQPASEEDELAMAINASLQSALEEGVPISNSQPDATFGMSNGFIGLEKHNESTTSEAGSSISPHGHLRQHNNAVAVPCANNPSSSVGIASASPAVEADGPIHYPSIDSSPIPLDQKVAVCDDHKEGIGASGSCVICLDAAVEGACIPCGHMAGCMGCLNEIKAKNWGCPVCRTKIDQVVKLYSV